MFEFDERKSQSNLIKHGIDFVGAQELWNDPGRVTIRARTSDEPRYLVVGKSGTKIWSAVVTIRNMTIRLISIRRARKSEVEIYES